jgi:hypothetical protein
MPVIRKLGDEVLYRVAVVPGLGGGGHLLRDRNFSCARFAEADDAVRLALARDEFRLSQMASYGLPHASEKRA